MYKKLGFVACEEPVTFDLGSYGGTGIHTHVGLLRKPREVSMS
jgi:hypothetical protein